MTKRSYLFPMPLPRSLASDQCEAFLFDDTEAANLPPSSDVQASPGICTNSLTYPFPIAEEIWKCLPFPQSLCIFGNACSVKEIEADNVKSIISTCPVTKLMGCPFYLLDFSEFASFAECKDVEIFDFASPEGKQFEKDADKIVKNFNLLGTYHRAPIIVLGHDEGQEFLAKEGLPAAGIVSNVKRIGSKLFSDFIDVPKKIADLINLKAYRFVSSEIYKNFFFNGEFVGPVLRRVALLGADVPKVKGLDDILARYSDSDPNQILVWIKKGDQKPMRQTFEFKNLSGSFAKGDKITAGDANGVVESLEGNVLIIESVSEFKSGQTVVGPNGSAELEPAYPFPYSTPEKKAETPAVTTSIPQAVTQIPIVSTPAQFIPVTVPPFTQELTMNAEVIKVLAEKDKQITELRSLSSQLKDDISLINSQLTKEKLDKESSKRISHAKEVEFFCEKLKTEGMSAALIDESGFRAFAMAMDWQKPFKFSEREEEKTSFEKFAELITAFAQAGKEGKLLVPLTRLAEGEENEFGEFVPMDQEALNMDHMVTKFAEQKKISYKQAFEELNKSGKLYQ